MKSVLVTLLCLCAVPVWAQPKPTPLQVVETVRQHYPTVVTQSQLGALMREIVEGLNAAQVEGYPYGLLKKTSGRACDGYACDTVCKGNGEAQQQWDVLIASGSGEARPNWGNPHTLPNIAVRECVIVMGSIPPPVVDPPPCPACPPPPPVICPSCPPDLSAEVADLRLRLQAAQETVQQLTAENEQLKNRRAEPANAFWRSLGIGCRIVP